jgi:ribonuclease T1
MRGRLFVTGVLLIGVVTAIWLQDIAPASAGRITFARSESPDPGKSGLGTISVSALPPEALDTLSMIKKGPPYPYRKDGTTFGNREKRLPARQQGYYKEFTVKTPGSHDRGARRIVAGAVGEYYYTDDHYRTFRLIRE